MPGEISLNSLVEVLALDKPVSFATVYVSPHVRSELEEQHYISVPPPQPPCCAHIGLYRKRHGKTSLPVT